MEFVGIESVRFNEIGLVPAVIQESKSGKVLMVAYMNKESLVKTVETGETWFYSRSRQELWHKGAVSGHRQRVIAASVDCDGDTLLFQVEQTGAACHTGRKTCFYRGLCGLPGKDDRSLSVFSDLQDRIEKKRLHPTEKSYTAYLLETGTDKICKKIGEEAAEVIIAAKNVAVCADAAQLPQLREEAIGESADLFYHMAVLWEAVGLTVQDVAACLAARSRKEENKKETGHCDKTF